MFRLGIVYIKHQSLNNFDFIFPILTLFSFLLKKKKKKERSGRDKRRSDWNCQRRLEIILRCKGCSPRRISTLKAWCRIWTLEQRSTYTGDLRRPRRRCSVLSFPGFFCTVSRAPTSRRRLCPPSPVCYPDQRHRDERRDSDSLQYMAALNSTIKEQFYW